MYLIGLVLAYFLNMTGVPQETTMAWSPRAEIGSLAVNMLLYHQGVLAFAQSPGQAAFAGTATDAEAAAGMAAPYAASFVKMGPWISIVSGSAGPGRSVVTYVGGALPGGAGSGWLGSAIYDAGGADMAFGIARAGTVMPIRAAAGTTPLVLPIVVPDGVAVLLSYTGA
ncbi:MAG: hypothetical protein ACT6RU_14485 [Aliihoeflea sp.]|uniref:hypothetical protein n=1 Tax=Aliihoeflea sp. TaxID=2608088 RepID=UPI0040336E07